MRVLRFTLLSITITLMLVLTTSARHVVAKPKQTDLPKYCWNSEHVGYCKTLCPKSIRYIRPYPLSNGKNTMFVWPLTKETACNDILLQQEIDNILNTLKNQRKKKSNKLHPVTSRLI